MPSNHTLIVLGSGPGIGIATAKAFAKPSHFSRIALLARNPSRLEFEKQDVQSVSGSDVTVHAYPVDLTDFEALRKTFAEIEKLGPLGCVFYNAARVRYTEVLASPVEEMEEDFRTSNLAMYLTAQWSIPLLRRSAHPSPSFLVTNSFLPETPFPQVLSLSTVKAAQQNMVLNLREAFGKEIHFGLVKVGGPVSPEAKNLNPENIAAKALELWGQEKGAWEWKVDIHQ